MGSVQRQSTSENQASCSGILVNLAVLHILQAGILFSMQAVLKCMVLVGVFWVCFWVLAFLFPEVFTWRAPTPSLKKKNPQKLKFTWEQRLCSWT